MRDALVFSMLWTVSVTVLAALPLIVAIAYSVVRSREPAAERRARGLYLRLLEEELHGERCFSCRTPVEPDWLGCPVCAAELRERCGCCGSLLKPHWSVCPYCASDARRPEQVAAA